jgi:hypothetical protein
MRVYDQRVLDEINAVNERKKKRQWCMGCVFGFGGVNS